MVSVLESAQAAERLAAADAFLDSLPSAAECVVVSASREAADDLVRGLCRRRGATFGLHRFSVLQLASRLATTGLARDRLAPTTTLSITAVAARAAFETSLGAGLQYFGPVAGRPGFRRALAATCTELRLAHASPRDLPGVSEAADDLAALYGEFNRQLTAAGVADTAAILRAATASLATDPAPRFVGWPLVLLDVPAESTAERDFLEALVRRAPQALVTVPHGDPFAPELWGGLAAERVHGAPPDVGRSLGRLRRFLFSSEDAAPAGADDAVVLFSAPGEAREAVEIARRVLEEAGRGVPFDRMAVLLRAPALYRGLLETAFGRAGIPAYFSRGTLRPDPAGRAFVALLDCAVERLSARRFAEYLSLGQVPALQPEGTPPSATGRWTPPSDDALGRTSEAGQRTAPVQFGLPFDLPPVRPEAPAVAPAPDPDALDEPADEGEAVVAGTLRAPWRWEELLVEAAVIGGRDRWSRRLDGLRAELALRREELVREDPDSARVTALDRTLGDLDHLRRFCLPLVEALDALPPAAPWSEWLERLEALATRSLRSPDRVLRVLAELRPMAQVGPVGLAEVRDVLADRLTVLEDDPPPQRYGRVFVGTLDQARGRVFDVVFAPGLAERIFPQKTREDPLLLDAARERLEPLRLRTKSRRAPAERLLLHLAAGAASERIYFSYPRMGLELGEPRPRVPSFYGLDVQRATTGCLPDVEQLERRAEAEAEARLAWPAPPSAASAIDELEHDLATLGRLLHGSVARDVEGRARYLLQLNEHLARSLRARWARWGKQWSAYDGVVRPLDHVSGALARHRLSARAYSVSALQQFSTCPYRFLLSGVYRLEPREVAGAIERLDPLTRGSLFHEVQAEFLRELERRGQLPLTPASLDGSLACLSETLRTVSLRRRDDLAPAIEQVWNDEIGAMEADLREWAARLAHAGGEWEPIRFEFGFGMPPDPKRDPRSVADPAVLFDRYRLHGVVDLIEQRSGSSALRVTDHKTGLNRTREGLVIGGGELLQPVLYSLAIEAALGRTVETSRLYFCTARGGFSERAVELTPAAREAARTTLETIERGIGGAFLPAAPREKACAYCDFLEVCGPHEEKRVARKDARRLADLAALREHP